MLGRSVCGARPGVTGIRTPLRTRPDPRRTPAARSALYGAIRASDLHINDAAFAEAMASELVKLLAKREVASQRT